MKQPDPKIHFYISLVKSVLRIVAGGCIALGSVLSGGLLLIAAELLGIMEEVF